MNGKVYYIKSKTLTYLLRLLRLPESVQRQLGDGKLTAGHARTLVGHPKAEALASRIIAGNLSVREAERLAKAPELPPRRKEGHVKDADTQALEADLSAALGMGVRIDAKPAGEGRVTITYRTLDALDDLVQLLAAGRPGS